MRPLRNPGLLALALSSALLLLLGCGSAATSPGGPVATSSTTSGAPSEVPAADGAVTGQGTVIEMPGGGPELCLGPVRESYPPQCDGIPLAGWDWETAGVQDEAGDAETRTRWGTYAVTGGFDGRARQVTGAVPLALYDVPASPSPRPVAPPRLTQDQWAEVEETVSELPGALTVVREAPTGPVHVTLVHDDGSFADWAVAAFGPGAVLVTSALR